MRVVAVHVAVDAGVDHVAVRHAVGDDGAGELYLLGLGELVGQGALDAAGELRVGLLLDALDLVPQRRAVAPPIRRAVGERDAEVGHDCLVLVRAREVVDDAVALALDSRAREVGGTGDG